MNKSGVLFVLAVLLGGNLAAQPGFAGAGNADVNRNPGDPTDGGGNSGTPDDPNNITDRNEPTNNACGGAELWRGRTRDSTNGHVGPPTDGQDWSKVELYRTESVAPA